MNQQLPLQIPKVFRFQSQKIKAVPQKKSNTLLKANYKKKTMFRYQILHYPGLYMNNAEIEILVQNICDVASTTFNPIPQYQAMRGNREDLSDKIIALAWDGSILAGFASTVELYIPTVGNILHLGLTVVRPEYRSNGLTHFLIQKAVTSYIIKKAFFFDKLWITNCAAVLSSLVNVALHFEHVYPSPKEVNYSPQHTIIAETINALHRDKLYINPNSTFDVKNHIFRGSVKGTAFQKDANDTAFYHRNHIYNDYYKNLMDINNGDEILQVGYASVPAAIRHAIFNSIKLITPH